MQDSKNTGKTLEPNTGNYLHSRTEADKCSAEIRESHRSALIRSNGVCNLVKLVGDKILFIKWSHLGINKVMSITFYVCLFKSETLKGGKNSILIVHSDLSDNTNL